jgi:FMN phosphatase YigB (HAD superfamily)
MFRAAVAAAGVPAASCFFTDDRQPIVDCARAFGIDAMLFRGPEHLAAELRKRDLL